MDADLAGVDRVVAWLQLVLVQGKAWLLFALVFGAGFAVMMDRASNRSDGFATMYLRRTGILWLLGAAHVALLWAGDILHIYAVAGALLLVMLRGPSWWLLLPVPAFGAALLLLGGRGYLAGVIGFVLLAGAAAWMRRGGIERIWKAGVALCVSPPIVIICMMLPGLMGEDSPERQTLVANRLAEWNAEVEQASSVIRDGSYLENVLARVAFVVEGLPDETRLLVAAIGMFLIGVWFVRSGLVLDPNQHRRRLVKLATTTLCFGLPLALASAAMGRDMAPERLGITQLAFQVMTVANLAISVGVACGVLWMIQAGVRMSWLAPAGRMALTNYLAQSAIGTLIFHGYGAGLAGQIGRTWQLALVVILFMAQLAISTWWLRRFHLGPVEWLWRAGIYRTWPAMLQR